MYFFLPIAILYESICLQRLEGRELRIDLIYIYSLALLNSSPFYRLTHVTHKYNLNDYITSFEVDCKILTVKNYLASQGIGGNAITPNQRLGAIACLFGT